MTTTPEEFFRRQIEEDRAAVQRAKEKSRRITKTLEQSHRVRQTVLPKLRRAGQLR
jgi:hypothetical protein